jgi:hypothetical protein
VQGEGQGAREQKRTVPLPVVAAYARAAGQGLSAEDVEAITELVMAKLNSVGA